MQNKWEELVRYHSIKVRNIKMFLESGHLTFSVRQFYWGVSLPKGKGGVPQLVGNLLESIKA